jgi:nucleoside 2-deoxyribosyltransferase
MTSSIKVYLASPLGFSSEHDPYREKVKSVLVVQGCTVFDPWEQEHFDYRIRAAQGIMHFVDRVEVFQGIAADIGRCNEDGIRNAEVVFAILDGAEVDSGTASEVGFGSALGKRCYGLRTDIRDSGDFHGVPVNLQVLHFIERTGGKLFRRIDDIVIARNKKTTDFSAAERDTR